MTISLCTFLRAVSYGLLLPFYVCGTELRRSLQRQGLQPVVLVLALTVILQWAQTFATLGGQYVGIVCSIALYAITAYALLHRSIGLAVQQALCFFLLTDCTDTIMRFANMRLLGYDPLRSGTFWAALLAYLPLTTVQGTLLWLLRSFCPAEKLRILRSAALALYVLAAVPYLFVCRLTYWLPLTNEELTTAVPVLLTGCCVLALLVNISFLSYAIAEEEKRTMLQLRIAAEQQQQQYLLRKTAVDSVRCKYHDLKNILLYLEQSSDQATVQAHIRQILQEVQPYEQMTATGNETVDILLGEKLARCQQAQIACTITVDGKLLNFIQPIDLCVIFGNAMDNAIEACSALPDPDSRALSVRCQKRGGFVVLNFRNACLQQYPLGHRKIRRTDESAERERRVRTHPAVPGEKIKPEVAAHLCSGLWCLLCPGHRLIQQFRLLRVQGVHGNILCGAGQTSVYPGGSARAKTQVVFRALARQQVPAFLPGFCPASGQILMVALLGQMAGSIVQHRRNLVPAHGFFHALRQGQGVQP